MPETWIKHTKPRTVQTLNAFLEDHMEPKFQRDRHSSSAGNHSGAAQNPLKQLDQTKGNAKLKMEQTKAINSIDNETFEQFNQEVDLIKTAKTHRCTHSHPGIHLMLLTHAQLAGRLDKLSKSASHSWRGGSESSRVESLQDTQCKDDVIWAISSKVATI